MWPWGLLQSSCYEPKGQSPHRGGQRVKGKGLRQMTLSCCFGQAGACPGPACSVMWDEMFPCGVRQKVKKGLLADIRVLLCVDCLSFVLRSSPCYLSHANWASGSLPTSILHLSIDCGRWFAKTAIIIPPCILCSVTLPFFPSKVELISLSLESRLGLVTCPGQQELAIPSILTPQLQKLQELGLLFWL